MKFFIFMIYFHFSKSISIMLKLKINFKHVNNKRTFVNLFKDIVLVTRISIICTTLFTNINIKVVIQRHAFLMDQFWFFQKFSKWKRQRWAEMRWEVVLRSIYCYTWRQWDQINVCKKLGRILDLTFYFEAKLILLL